MPQFNSQSAADAARRSHAESSTRDDSIRAFTPMVQAVQLQRALHKVGMAVAADTSNLSNAESRAIAESSARIGASLASIAKGWDSLAARVQILRGKAAPGTLSPAERRAKAESKRSAPKRDGPRLPRPAAPSPAQDATSKESLS